MNSESKHDGSDGTYSSSCLLPISKVSEASGRSSVAALTFKPLKLGATLVRYLSDPFTLDTLLHKYNLFTTVCQLEYTE